MVITPSSTGAGRKGTSSSGSKYDTAHQLTAPQPHLLIPPSKNITDGFEDPLYIDQNFSWVQVWDSAGKLVKNAEFWAADARDLEWGPGLCGFTHLPDVRATSSPIGESPL